ncbi:MAG: hypothetical protein SLAVMIC_00339 [uncultured marine phage]|uniref:Uncharacterized protein n=1 Tax=uncultured marine phage TaxID=707152 RepID=A0A8D9CBE0_9VIRU|nr:MAG: hypothetical protein SLAVMIC_00339 [uncultured marine phage]
MINNKVAKFLLTLSSRGIANNGVKSNYPNYLDFDGDLVTFINSNTVEKNGIKNPWIVNTRQGTKMVRVIRRILTNEYVDKNMTAQDIELFVADWQASLENTCTIEVLRGFDILKAFNYGLKTIDLNKFQTSCANFGQHIKGGYPEPHVKWFYVYIYNESCSVAVVKENGIIKARSVMFTGEQVDTYGDYKKGETYTYMNGTYSEGDTKYQSMLRNWGVERGYLFNGSNPSINRGMSGSFVIPFKTHYKTYCPIDSIHVDVKNNYLVVGHGHGNGRYGGEGTDIKRAYKLVQNGGRLTHKNVKQ